MELDALHKRVIGLDVHQAQITACALIEENDGTTRIEQRQFSPFRKDRRTLAEWAAALCPDEVVMESSGIYWKSPHAALEAVGIRAKVVNARHVRNVPGRKTDVGDAQWLATLSQAGLLRASFIPPAMMRELRLIARQREKLVGQLASGKNRLHKILADPGIRPGAVVSAWCSAMSMVNRHEPWSGSLSPTGRCRRFRASLRLAAAQNQSRGTVRCLAGGTDRQSSLCA